MSAEVHRIRVDVTAVLLAANEVYEPEGAALWLHAGNRVLAGRSPFDVICAGETNDVLDLLDALASGVVL